MIRAIMDVDAARILLVNADAAGIKFDLYTATQPLQKLITCSVENIGRQGTVFSVQDLISSDHFTQSISASDHVQAAKLAARWIVQQLDDAKLAAIGHRIVYRGPRYHEPVIIDDHVLQDLLSLATIDPEHLPVELRLIGLFQTLFPDSRPVACFGASPQDGAPSDESEVMANGVYAAIGSSPPAQQTES